MSPHQNSTQAYLDIAAIKNGVVILKNGGLRAVLMVSSVNFALKSEQEQEDIVLRYQAFVNSLNFPIQIVMQSRQLDLTDYLAKLKDRTQNETNDQIRAQTLHYIAFVEKLLTVANIMDKRFYVVVPYDPVGLRSRGLIDQILHPARQVTVSMTEKQFGEYSIQVDERVGIVDSGLASMGLQTSRLGTKDIIGLYYTTYNPEEAVTERLAGIESLVSGSITREVGEVLEEERKWNFPSFLKNRRRLPCQ